jgi:hypothetical protein
MNVRNLIGLAKAGRPDLAAVNLGACPPPCWSHPVQLIRVIEKYPHSSGIRFDRQYLARCWREGRDLQAT